MRFASIWAQDHRGVIGSGTAMLWRVPADSRFFRQMTIGSPVIMGRASWEVLGEPLPQRVNIIVTSQPDYRAEGGVVVHSLDEAFERGRAEAARLGSDVVWVAGGARIYRETMDRVDELVVSQLDLTVPGELADLAHVPPVDERTWQVDPTRSDPGWREQSGDARWKVITYVRRPSEPND
ncbi:dihydrofolate reductase [Actinomyces sp. F1_1611]